jgi:hypothetical protein
MSSVTVSPVALRGANSGFRPLPMAPWAPPKQDLFFSPKRMSEKKMSGSFSSKEIPLSLALGAGSAGAIILGAQLPSAGWKGFFIGAGLLGLGYSISNLFSGPELPPQGVQSSGDAAKIPTKEAFEQLTGSFRKPRMYEQIDQPGPNWLMTANYFDIDVEFVLTNPTSESVTATLRLTQQETATRTLYPNSKESNTYSKIVTVPANTSITVPFDVKTLNWTGALTERLVMEKIRSGDPAESAVKLSEVTFFV